MIGGASGLQWLDAAHGAYLSMLTCDHRHNNPTALVFVGCLQGLLTERRLESRPWRATRLLSTRTRQLSVTIRVPLEHEITFRTRPSERLDVESFSHVSSSSFRGPDDARWA